MKPIPFNTEMVQAILDGRKTQFREALTETDMLNYNSWLYAGVFAKYKIGDTIYIQEEFARGGRDFEHIVFRDTQIWSMNWKQPSEMTAKEARIFLKVTNVRVERLQDISDGDIYDEGIELYAESWSDKNNGKKFNSIRWAWINLWNSTAKDGYKWEDNPYVFVYEFERVENE